MKTSTLFIILLTGSMITFAQTNRYDQPARSNYQNTYVSPDFNLMIKALNDRQALFDQNKAATDALINWIFELKSQTNEKQFIDAMNSFYQRLRAFDNQDFSLLSSQIRSIELGIKEEIDKYNSRIKETSEKSTEAANDLSSYWDAAMENVKNYDFNNAIINLTSVLQSSADYAPAYLYRGWALFNKQSFEGAVSDLSRAIELGLNDPSCYYYMGWAKYYQNDFMGSLSDFNRQIELDPNVAVGYYNRGSAKSALNDYYGAISDNMKAIELDPTFSMAYNNLGWAKFNQKKFSEALEYVNKAIELDANNSVAFDSRAEIKFNLNDYTGCIRDADIALGINPKLSNSYFLKGRAYYRLGKKDDACINWSKAGELGKIEAYEYISKYCK